MFESAAEPARERRLSEVSLVLQDKRHRGVLPWLVSIAILITIMVSIGGITRLTGSGLSITDWKPIMGAIPPLTDLDWQETFAKYQASPQGTQVNHQMALPEFKFIFFWEYFHRLVGRLIGFVSLVPLVYFWARKKISRRLAGRVLIGVALGGLQGALGWFMVKSGLVDLPAVSHFRLAAHLGLALFILAYFVWLIQDFRTGRSAISVENPARIRSLKTHFSALRALFILQIAYGAFVAGLKAGFGFNTFPKMAGQWFPGNFWALDPAWINPFENPASVQWIHRTLGWCVLVTAAAFLFRVRRAAVPREIRIWGASLGHMTFVQFLLGVATLVLVVPIPLAVLHQFGAALIVILLTGTTHAFSRLKADRTSG